MKCVYCGYADSKVIDSRPTDDGERIRRRRVCLSCNRRFTTYETVEMLPIIVVKKDKSKELFDSQKILRGLVRACEKRSVPIEVLEDAVASIESQLLSNSSREVSSVTIGEMVMDKLKDIDEVAYIRFASVYKQFKDIDSFMDELKKIKGEKTD